MSFGSSATYIYTYIGFAVVYLVASFVFVASALRVSTGMSRAQQAAPSMDAAEPPASAALVVAHGQRVVDYTQIATLLPLVYIVGSMFLGSVITRDVALARTVNVGWVLFTLACAAAIVGLTVLGLKESGAISQTDALTAGVLGRTEAVQRVGIRLGVSAALLLLVAVFMLLNLWSVVSSLDALSAVEFLL